MYWLGSCSDPECPEIISKKNQMREYLDTIQKLKINRRPAYRTPNSSLKGRLRLMQYNVEWLFVDYYESSDCPGNGCTWKNETAAMTHLKVVADTVAKLNPDILNLAEVEGCDELNLLAENIHAIQEDNGWIDSESYTPLLKRGQDSSTGQNVGMLTKITPSVPLTRTDARAKYPVEYSACGYTGEAGDTGVSKNYITEFILPTTYRNSGIMNEDMNNDDGIEIITNANEAGGLPVAMISAHLLANPNDPERCAKREAQAVVLQATIANYTRRGYEIVLIGDLNDYDDQIKDVNTNVPLSMTLDILKGTRGPETGAYQLYSVAGYIPREERFTDWYDFDGNCRAQLNEFSMIDHILVSRPLFKKIEQVFIYHGYKEFCAKYESDHFPVVVDFVL